MVRSFLGRHGLLLDWFDLLSSAWFTLHRLDLLSLGDELLSDEHGILSLRLDLLSLGFCLLSFGLSLLSDLLDLLSERLNLLSDGSELSLGLDLLSDEHDILSLDLVYSRSGFVYSRKDLVYSLIGVFYSRTACYWFYGIKTDPLSLGDLFAFGYCKEYFAKPSVPGPTYLTELSAASTFCADGDDSNTTFAVAGRVENFQFASADGSIVFLSRM